MKILTGQILRLALVKSGINQISAAEKLGLSVHTVRNQCKSNNPKLSTVTKYAELCNMKASELIALSE